MIYLAEFCRLFIFIVLVLAAWGKTHSFPRFRDSLADTLNVPVPWRLLSALGLVATEWMLAAMLLIDGPWRALAMQAALLLFVSFALYIASILIKHRLVSCHCFGRENRHVNAYDFYRALILIAACFIMLTFTSSALTLVPASQWLLFGCAFMFAQITIHLPDVATLLRHDA
ncbi:hypothetical protein LZP73_13760 [Shewanella sp. AS16]|uniref:MauE/DoxX family redox-associated membrane protein n=1 Tax=Shewanella sp. AS16 TaxID=2907625 RepID=UPI001F26EB7E|nr:MauE/DoxX family redox-associated membrane protein [Shewanella sp. AS16]MCE9687258.1 hypothetical protein [Shewanella sp. AS16]